jgi:UDP-N-acetylglucosamine 2-epimerase (non-hydrolysing)
MTRESDPDLAIVLGTRPEIIKFSPVIRGCEQLSIPFTVIHTGQHYSEELDEVFFEQLELPKPDHNLKIGSKPHGQQTAEMLAGIERILLDAEPDTVLVQGDTNTTLAGAIAASKLDTDLGHIEAGLRSFDREMPEELNRVLADHVADHLFAPTEHAAEMLRREGLPESRIVVTGNTVVDAVRQNESIASRRSSALDDLELSAGEFGLMTAHRAENVDDPGRFAAILDGVGRVAEQFDIEIVYPIHPRAEAKIAEFDLTTPASIRPIEPLDYFDFLTLESQARLILTDSGGVQEEACVLGVPCVTMRTSTERPETTAVGANHLAGRDATSILAGARVMLHSADDWDNPFGEEGVAERIIAALKLDIPAGFAE